MSKMKTMIPTNGSIVVARPRDVDGKVVQVSPPVGKPFDFTADELADIKRLTPGAVREPTNETREVTSADDDDGDDDDNDARKVAKPADDVEPPAKPAKAAKAAKPADDLGGL